jgi:hypothetical protein
MTISELYLAWCRRQKLHPNRYASDVHDLIAKAFQAGYLAAQRHTTEPEPQQRPE